MNQHRFAAALLDPDLPVPDGLVDPAGRPATRRFAVYRNNVAVGLTRALEAGFPAVKKLVGDEFFAAMAGVFLRAHPPHSRILMLYGDAFATFLQGFPPVAHLGYLPDVARLEQALRESYHAADHRAVTAEELAALPPEVLLQRKITLAPSARLIRSRWPVWSVWAANMQDGPPPPARHEDCLVLRAGFDPKPHLLPQGGGAFLSALIAGQPLGAAIDAAGPGFDASPVLTLLLTEAAIKECVE